MEMLAERSPDAIVVSGGADGPDRIAESFWIERGGQVMSYRAASVRPEVWGVARYQFGHEHWDGAHMLWYYGEPTFADRPSALNYRNLLIAEMADFGAVFWDGRSRGTALTMDALRAYGKPLEVYK
jgi:hypothetical protein